MPASLGALPEVHTGELYSTMAGGGVSARVWVWMLLDISMTLSPHPRPACMLLSSYSLVSRCSMLVACAILVGSMRFLNWPKRGGTSVKTLLARSLVEHGGLFYGASAPFFEIQFSKNSVTVFHHLVHNFRMQCWGSGLAVGFN